MKPYIIRITFPTTWHPRKISNLHQRHRTGEDHEVREATTKGASRHRKGVHTCRLWRRPTGCWMHRWWAAARPQGLVVFGFPDQMALPRAGYMTMLQCFPTPPDWHLTKAFAWWWGAWTDGGGRCLRNPPYNNSIDVRTSAVGEVELRWMWDVLEKWCWEMLGGKKSYDGPTIQSGEWRQAVCRFP